jgi:exopolyphosphatase / guanosine-5'-triphosphate,3'-diphosphate pyrophosphatase
VTPSHAIIDIGSNSVRLVVYDGPRRAPAVLFNEKVSAGLGRGLGNGAALDPKAADQALRALSRFRAVAEAMGVESIRTVATAAVRDASDGTAFIRRIEALGLAVELLSGDQEARASGYGVISAFPHADGIVGDLGGGSLELVRVRDGSVHESVSLPLGVLRLVALKKGRGVLDRHVRKLLAKAGWKGIEPGLPFWLVGGSWRALARLHMHLTDYPLPVLHGYAMPPEAASRLVRALGRMDRKRLKAIDALPTGRLSALGDAAALLATLTKLLGSGELVVSAYGLREGIIFEGLDAGARAGDPLIEAAHATGQALGRFPEHGDLLARWIAPLFPDEDQRCARLRHAACLLGDVGWMANPELRAERGLDIALYGNWVSVDPRGRAMIAHALYTSFGGGSAPSPLVAQLASPEDCATAAAWGLAMRFGQRLSGGVAGPLEVSRLVRDEKQIRLLLPADQRLLYGEAVERRHKQLAALLGRTAGLEAEVS